MIVRFTVLSLSSVWRWIVPLLGLFVAFVTPSVNCGEIGEYQSFIHAQL